MLEAVAEQPDNIGDLFDGGGAQLTDHYAEQQLIGYLLHRPGAVTETVDIISPVDLHDPLNRRLYELLIRSYEVDTPPTMETLAASLGGDKTAGVYIAGLMGAADLKIDVGEVADHLSTIAERRAVGTTDDDYVSGAPFTSKFGAQRWEDIGTGNSADLYPWLIEDVIPLVDISMAYGDSGTGKSFAMFDMAMCVARGIKFNNYNVEPGLVVYVAAEAGKGFAKRKIAYAVQHKLEPSEPLPFVLLTKRPNFFHDDTDALALIEEINSIRRMYEQRLVLIVLDTMSAITQGMDEISGKDQSAVRRRLMMLLELGAAVLVVHHKPKNGTGPRGHGSQTADIETTIEFETVTDKKTDTGKTIHRAVARKQREGKAGVSWEFTLPIIEVGTNKWGNPETSCVVQPYNVGAPRAGAVGFHATPTEKLFLRALWDALLDHPSPPPVGLPKAVSSVVEQRYVRELMRERTISAHENYEQANGRFRVAFKRAGDKLRDGGVIGVQGNLLWPTGKPVNGFTTTGGG